MADTFTRDRLAWLEAVQDSGQRGAAFSVAFALSRHLNRSSGQAFPSHDTLASYAGVSPRQVCEHIKRLRESGFLECRRRPNSSTVYRLTTPSDRKKTSDPDSRKTSDPDQKKTSPRTGGKLPFRTGRKLPPNSLRINPLKEPSEREARNAPARPCPLPLDWNPPEVWSADDARYLEGLTAETIEDETRKFRLHSAANGWRKADWDAAWLKWMTDAATRQAERMQNASKGARQGFSGLDYAMGKLG